MELMMNPRLTTPDSAMRNSSSSKRSWSGPRFQLERVKTEKARRSFQAFVKQAWPVLEPNVEFVEGIHIDAICEHLQAVTERSYSPPHHQRAAGPCQVAADRSFLAVVG